jgi:hypothetical protein
VGFVWLTMDMVSNKSIVVHFFLGCGNIRLCLEASILFKSSELFQDCQIKAGWQSILLLEANLEPVKLDGSVLHQPFQAMRPA